MRSTSRSFMAAVLFMVAAGVARAQDSAAPPPVAPEPVVAPVPAPAPELPALPVADPNAPAVEPARTIDQSAIAVEPFVPAKIDPPVAVVEKPEVATTTKRVAKKTVKKPAEKPAEVEVSEIAKPAAAAAGVAAVAADTSANPPPPNAAASTEPATSAAPPPPAADPAVETLTEEARSERSMGIGGWLLAGLVVASLFALITLYRRRKAKKVTSIPDFTGAQELKPLVAPRS